MPAANTVDTDSVLEFGRAEVVAGGQCVAGVERGADARLVLDQFVDVGNVKVGCEISFMRFFYWPQPLCGLEEIWGDMRVLERESYGLLEESRGGV
ncbi:MAG: hypothetical protein OXF86_21340 [Caldilineaceae bacterium]|nr:hypothetical protein [Caldilineaceae bacterium]